MWRYPSSTIIRFLDTLARIRFSLLRAHLRQTFWTRNVDQTSSRRNTRTSRSLVHVVQSCMKLSDFDGCLYECRSTVLMGFLTNLIYKFYYYYGFYLVYYLIKRILAHAPTFADFPVFCESLLLLQTTFDVRSFTITHRLVLFICFVVRWGFPSPPFSTLIILIASLELSLKGF